MKVVLMGKTNDFQVNHVAARLRQHGAATLLFSGEDVGTKLLFSWDAKRAEGVITNNEVRWHFSEIDACYWHYFSLNAPYHECKNMQALLQLFFAQANIHWVNSISAIRYHHIKPMQLSHARLLGARIPETYVGNELEAAADFIAAHPDCIVKPVHGGKLTRRLPKVNHPLPVAQALMNDGPVTLQRCIHGSNVRTFVVGDAVVSAELISTHIDYRQDDSTRARVFVLDDAHTTLAQNICRAFHMKWCAIDWRLSEQGELFFLEANPCPYFYHFEVSTQHAITDMLCRLLVREG